MIKWILAFVFMVLILGIALDVFAQVIVIDPVSGGVKDIIILPLPAPTWR
jgi:hypothetical protein